MSSPIEYLASQDGQEIFNVMLRGLGNELVQKTKAHATVGLKSDNVPGRWVSYTRGGPIFYQLWLDSLG